MLDTEILKLAIPALIAVLGWFAGHQFNVYRDRINKRRDLRIQYLLEAYRRLESVANRRNKTEAQALAFESAVADIQLLGTPEQIEATVKYLCQHASEGGAQIDEVLALLRHDLREELKLSSEVPKAVVFRFIREP
jgi:hypothetical protein